LSLFVSFEGGEGSGKSTQAKLLRDRLTEAGHPVLLVHEPGTTPLGLYLREWLKRQTRQEETISPAAELFLFAAARAELAAKVIKPFLGRRDAIVLSDRYMDSTTAYQGHGRRMDLARLQVVNELATQGAVPDLTFLLDLSPEDGLARVRAKLTLEQGNEATHQRQDREGMRRFEEEALTFHRRVRDGYLKLARQEPARWRVLDATKPVDELSKAVWAEVEGRIRQLSGVNEMDPKLMDIEKQQLGDASKKMRK
jgi:dTMP kinase